MTISTNYMFEQAVRQMGDLRTGLAQANSQLSTGLKVTRPSDDPDKSGAIDRLRSAIARQDSYTSTLGILGDRLRTSETSLQTATDVLNRVKELALQARNDTVNPQDRANIATELDSLRAELQALAATRDTNGNYVFSGTRVTQAPFATTVGDAGEYLGDQTGIQVDTGDQRPVTVNLPGSEAFAGIVRQNGDAKVAVGFFQSLDDLVASVRNSDRTGMQRGIDEMDELQSGFSQAIVKAGAEQSAIETQRTQLEQARVGLQTTLSGLQDVDYTEAILRLQKQSLSLEAAQSSFAKISALNLFNYVK